MYLDATQHQVQMTIIPFTFLRQIIPNICVITVRHISLNLHQILTANSLTLLLHLLAHAGCQKVRMIRGMKSILRPLLICASELHQLVHRLLSSKDKSLACLLLMEDSVVCHANGIRIMCLGITIWFPRSSISQRLERRPLLPE